VTRPLLALAVLLLPAAAGAHDFWAESAADGFVFRRGHRGGRLLRLDRAHLKALRCATGDRPAADLRAEVVAAGAELRVAARCDAVSASLHRGFFSITPDGEVSLPKDRVPDAVRSWESRQYAKWIDPGVAGAARPLGDALEVVPVSDLSRARAGDRATFRVLLDGEPLPGAAVASGHEGVARTDRAGEARVKLPGPGLASVAATVRRRIATPQADTLMLEASLTFVVAP
jgi:hypothetical protein